MFKKKCLKILIIFLTCLVGSLVSGCKNKNDESTKDIQQFSTERTVLARNWKEQLNHGIIHDNEIQKIVFLDLLEESEMSMNNAIDAIYHPKNEEESSQDSGDIYMWVEEINGLYVLCIGAEGGVWAPTDASKLFFNITDLEEIIFSDAFHTDNVTDMHHMFASCSNLLYVDVAEFNTSNVTNMWGLFGNCSNLETVDVGNFDTSNVTNMSGMFGGCEKIEQVDVSGFDTSQVTDMTAMFMSCSNLATVDCSNFSFDAIGEKGMEYMFVDCINLELPDDISVPEYADPNETMFLGTPMYQNP